MKLIKLLLLLLFVISCTAQTKPKSAEALVQSKINTVTQPKIKKGANQYAAVNVSLQDKAGNLWFSASGQGAYRYDGKSFTNFTDKDGLTNNSVYCMLEDKAGNIWFTTWFEGLCRYDGKLISRFKPFNEVWFASVLEDKNGTIWVGSRTHGAYCYDGKTFTNFLNTKIFNECCIYSMTQDKVGNIWFATEFDDIATRDNFGGLWYYDGKTFKNYTTKDGLTNNAVFSLTTDKTGNLWIGTRNTGLCRYDGNNFTNFSE